MKIISTKRYKELLDIEEKYKYLKGEMFTIYIGGRSRKARLLLLPKEELVKMIFDLNNDKSQLQIVLHKKELESKGE